MSYEKTVWAAGDVITAEKLNNIEDGIEAASNGGGVFYVNITDNDPTITADKTPAEIGEAYENNCTVCCKVGNAIGYLQFIQKINDDYFPGFIILGVSVNNYFDATRYVYERPLGGQPTWKKYTYTSE